MRSLTVPMPCCVMEKGNACITKILSVDFTRASRPRTSSARRRCPGDGRRGEDVRIRHSVSQSREEVHI